MKKICTRCGKEVDILESGKMEEHYAPPGKSLGLDFCRDKNNVIEAVPSDEQSVIRSEPLFEARQQRLAEDFFSRRTGNYPLQ